MPLPFSIQAKEQEPCLRAKVDASSVHNIRENFMAIVVKTFGIKQSDRVLEEVAK